MEHTKGPWKIREEDFCIQSTFDNSIVAKVLPWDAIHPSKEDLGNLKLISKAPELLDLINIIHKNYSFTIYSKDVLDRVEILIKELS